MTGQTDVTPPTTLARERMQRRHTIAAVVYFLYGLFYLFGAQYLTTMQATERGMAHPAVWFLIGGIIAVLFPLLLYHCFAVGLSWQRKQRPYRTTLHIDFALLLGLALVMRVLGLVMSGAYSKSSLHIAATLVAALNAGVQFWASMGQPVWISRESQGS